MQYRAGLLQLVYRCQDVVKAVLPDIEAHWPRPRAGDSIRVGDSIPSGVDAAIKRAAAKLGNLDEWAKRMVGLAVEANRDSVDERLGRAIKEAIGVDVSRLLKANGPLLQSMRSATADNIALIKSIPEQYFGRVTETITAGWVQGLRWESLVGQIERDGEITENRAKLIARDQTGKMNSAFNRELQQQVGIERFEWSTSQDERVRGNPSGKYPDAVSDHWALNGRTFRWDEPGPCRGTISGEPCHPGEDVNDRCVALPIVDMAELAFGEQRNEEEMAA
jgi:uncharacterized protein with gpF-like domain